MWSHWNGNRLTVCRGCQSRRRLFIRSPHIIYGAGKTQCRALIHPCKPLAWETGIFLWKTVGLLDVSPSINHAQCFVWSRLAPRLSTGKPSYTFTLNKCRAGDLCIPGMGVRPQGELIGGWAMCVNTSLYSVRESWGTWWISNDCNLLPWLVVYDGTSIQIIACILIMFTCNWHVGMSWGMEIKERLYLWQMLTHC